MAIWAVSKFDASLECLAIKWGWTWLQNDPNAWRVKYPKITDKIDELKHELRNSSLNNPTLTTTILSTTPVFALAVPPQ